ncbi:hypothetical protein K437DRAFT_269022 [Tilletiaria anomala UBC 951]|uniref:Protein scd2/ral3 n=1 Tax=Tilletiaria anomala (strain ATCC 24038 / CBS 436.72 / UBC 951) TaxID=1037660 RepID=A0A066VU33_TILAU|nr:uncharacterized protein K437DRAFT_269022 [Tilletiaria anomala UBC 951]KDN43778.1 hypothetical protein K437DRAFT_269022 [Tilletiaria anomala UBC 951]
MKGLKDFRRSLNKDRSSGGKPGTGTPAMFTGVKSAVSIQPPKMVIKALREYRSRAPQELSFQKGDFFHVLSDSSNPDWFEAANPMTNARGLVPSAYFEVITRSNRPGASGQAGPSTIARGPLAASGPQPGVAGNLDRAAGAAMPGKSGGGLYAVVKYDFEAERTDELAAKAGESIIVIAQSNYEWFVAKPIGRLGGPGLIPVAYVEIKDLTTGQPIEDVNELISTGVIPKVEEWKKMTADYKNTAIPLGRLDFQTPAAGSGPGGAMDLSFEHHGMGAMDPSFPNNQPPPLPPPKQGSLDLQAGDDQELPPGLPPGEPLPTGIISSATVDSFHFEQGDYWFRIQAAHVSQSNANAPPSAPTAPEGEERDLILYRLYEDFYEFQIALLDHFPAEAGRETDANGNPTQRILPLMPGPLEEVDDVITAQRRGDLDLYINQLCALPEYIMRSELIRLFFEPRPGDHCSVIPTSGAGEAPASDDGLGQEAAQVVQAAAMLETVQSNGTSKYAEDQPVGPNPVLPNDLAAGVESLKMDERDRMSQSGSDGRSSGATGPSGSSYLQPQYSMTRNQSATTVGSRGSGASSTHAGWSGAGSSSNTVGRKDSLPGAGGASTPSTGSTGAGASAGANAHNTGPNAGFIKIKIFHRATDDLVAIRVPPSVTHSALMEKVRDRLGADINVLRYRETLDTGGSAMMRLSDDEDLRDWLSTGAQKLTLYADTK